MYLCLSRDVAQNGYRKLDRSGKSLLITRSKHNNVFVDENVCRHRGYPVAQEEAGLLPLRCPYHDLVFHNLGQIPAQEFRGFIFQGSHWDHVTGTELSILSSIGEEFGKHEMAVEAPAALWMQNTMDPGHLVTVHKNSFARFFPDDLSIDCVNLGKGNFSSYRLPLRQEISESYKRFTSSDSEFYFFRHLSCFPNLSVTTFAGVFASVESVEDRGARCFVTTRFFLHASAKDVPKKLLAFALGANRTTLEEDKKVCEGWAKGRYTRSPDLWLPGEERVRHYFELLNKKGYQ